MDIVSVWTPITESVVTKAMYQSVPPPGSSKEDSTHSEPCPKNISLKTWEKFKMLEKRTNDVTRRSTQKRIKHLQKEIINKVQAEISLPGDQDILREHEVKLSSNPSTLANRPGDKSTHSRKRKGGSCERAGGQDGGGGGRGGAGYSWQDLKPHLNAHEHLKDLDHGHVGPKSKLEKAIDAAIQEGNVEEAERLSDHLSSREFGVKIANAFDAVDFVKKKKQEEETAAAKRKKSLPWGFQQKHRWETKSNM